MIPFCDPVLRTHPNNEYFNVKEHNGQIFLMKMHYFSPRFLNGITE